MCETKLMCMSILWVVVAAGSVESCNFASPQHPYVISTTAQGAYSVFAADIDGDGDMDVLSASYIDDKIAWYENLGGNGTFAVSEHVISPAANGARSAFAADIDGDGDVDVLSASANDDKIAWYENVNGNGIFGMGLSEHVVSTSADGANSVFAADIDGDGDMDVLSASKNDDKIVWYENLDGNGTFTMSEHVISTSAHGARSVFSADIDGDGDMDVLSASANDDKIAWYENLGGNGTFAVSEHVISTSADYAVSVFAADIDGDGDMDVLSASALDDKIAWYENLDGNGTFIKSEHVISTAADRAFSVFAADIDGDGDMDVLSASANDDKIVWYENLDGNGTFDMALSEHVISTAAKGARSVFAADIDGDGDMDVMSASLFDNKIAWYENIECSMATTTSASAAPTSTTSTSSLSLAIHSQSMSSSILTMTHSTKFDTVSFSSLSQSSVGLLDSLPLMSIAIIVAVMLMCCTVTTFCCFYHRSQRRSSKMIDAHSPRHASRSPRSTELRTEMTPASLRSGDKRSKRSSRRLSKRSSKHVYGEALFGSNVYGSSHTGSSLPAHYYAAGSVGHDVASTISGGTNVFDQVTGLYASPTELLARQHADAEHAYDLAPTVNEYSNVFAQYQHGEVDAHVYDLAPTVSDNDTGMLQDTVSMDHGTVV